jgi:hypothetical protein
MTVRILKKSQKKRIPTIFQQKGRPDGSIAWKMISNLCKLYARPFMDTIMQDDGYLYLVNKNSLPRCIRTPFQSCKVEKILQRLLYGSVCA